MSSLWIVPREWGHNRDLDMIQDDIVVLQTDHKNNNNNKKENFV